jgi:hypothetical protein
MPTTAGLSTVAAAAAHAGIIVARAWRTKLCCCWKGSWNSKSTQATVANAKFLIQPGAGCTGAPGRAEQAIIVFVSAIT